MSLHSFFFYEIIKISLQNDNICTFWADEDGNERGVKVFVTGQCNSSLIRGELGKENSQN